MIPLVRAPPSLKRLTNRTFTPDFYNYPQYGIDFLISGATHTVRKIILHTNIVGLITTDIVYGLNVDPTNSLAHLCSTDTNDAHGRSRGCQRTTRMVGIHPSCPPTLSQVSLDSPPSVKFTERVRYILLYIVMFPQLWCV